MTRWPPTSIGPIDDGKIYICTKCGHRSHMINDPHNCINVTIREEPELKDNKEVLFQALAVIYELVAKAGLSKDMTIPNSYFNFMEDYADEIALVETRN
jgi:hypothetical protein